MSCECTTNRNDDYAEVPEAVQSCIAALAQTGIWHALSRNEPAYSCIDAASKRVRDGQIGILLSDELKTLVVKSKKSPISGISYVALHCRASDQIDFGSKWIRRVVGRNSTQVSSAELAETFDGAEYGAINPISLAVSALMHDIGMVQVFDTAAMPSNSTMMTNAGHHEYGLELQPRNMFVNFPSTLMVLPIRK